MKTVALIIGIIFFVVIGSVAVSYVNAYNYGARTEASLSAQYQNNQNILSQYSQKVQEAAQVPSMYRDDVTKVVTSALNARYGAEGSKAVFQWIQEQNPTLDPKVYVKIQEIIDAGRSNFERGQTRLLDERRSYEANLNSFWMGTWLRVVGYPKTDLSRYNPVVTEQTRTIFENHTESSPIKLR